MDAIVAPDPIPKHPDESLLLAMEFCNLLEEGETLAGLNTGAEGGPVTADQEGLTLGDPAIVGTAVQFRVTGGIAEIDYRITVEVMTSAANIRSAIGILRVSD